MTLKKFRSENESIKTKKKYESDRAGSKQRNGIYFQIFPKILPVSVFLAPTHTGKVNKLLRIFKSRSIENDFK